ncbi:hypothetical protein B6U74_00020 [Candidatus Bathyarchaeota archaeon ex4484_205]|nr:MAG: hypothetical protein B6U74_00020 [Candidatus Bathyarchaeota archaeon ex4484_205]RLG69205.1 MAG: hypothetical protein DRN93_00690 [archaeon]
MAYGVLLLKVEWKNLREVIKKVAELEKVVDVFPVYGEYDVVVIIEGEDYAEIATITSEVNGYRGVKRSETLVAG